MAATASTLISNPSLSPNAIFLSQRNPSTSSCLFGNKFFGKPLLARAQTERSDETAPSRRLKLIKASSSHTFDVVVVGAGIIGLSIARQFLTESDLSVAVVDAAVPCAGATGAGNWICNTFFGLLVDGGVSILRKLDWTSVVIEIRALYATMADA